MAYSQNFSLPTEQFIGGQPLFQEPVADTTGYAQREQDFMNLFSQQEKQRGLQSQVENQQIARQQQQAQRQLQGQQTSSGLGFSGMAQQQLGDLQGRADLLLTEKEQKDITEKQFAKREKIQQLRQQFATEMAKDVQRKFQQNVQKFNRDFSQFNKTAEGKFINERYAARKYDQAQYDKAVANISRRMNIVNTFNRIHQSVAGLLSVIHPVAGMIAQAGATTGQMISTGAGNRQNQRLANAFRQGRSY